MHTSPNMFAQTALQFIGGMLLYADPMCLWHRSEMLPGCVLITDMPLLMQKLLIGNGLVCILVWPKFVWNQSASHLSAITSIAGFTFFAQVHNDPSPAGNLLAAWAPRHRNLRGCYGCHAGVRNEERVHEPANFIADVDSTPAQHCYAQLSNTGNMTTFNLIVLHVCDAGIIFSIAQAVPLKAFVSAASDVKLDDFSPLSMTWPVDLMSQRPSRKSDVTCDMSPARDMSLTDREATRRIVQARGVDPASTSASDMNSKFHVMVAVRSHRRCQETAYRHFVLRMRMKAMYAFIASSKSSGLSACPHDCVAVPCGKPFAVAVILLRRQVPGSLPCIRTCPRTEAVFHFATIATILPET